MQVSVLIAVAWRWELDQPRAHLQRLPGIKVCEECLAWCGAALMVTSASILCNGSSSFICWVRHQCMGAPLGKHLYNRNRLWFFMKAGESATGRVHKQRSSWSPAGPASAVQEWCPSQALPAAAAGGPGALLCQRKRQNITFLQVLSGELAWALLGTVWFRKEPLN